MTKDNPEIYKEAVKRAGGVIPDTFFFDDNLNAVKTAIKAGLHTTAVYDAASEGYVEELQAVSNRFVYTFTRTLTGQEYE